MSWNAVLVGFFLGVWITYSIVGFFHDIRSAKHVFWYGVFGIGSSLMTTWMLHGRG